MSVCDDVLKIDDRIRFVAHLDNSMNLVEMKQRPGVRSLTTEETDLDFFGFIQPIIMKISSDLEKDFGNLKTVRINYDRCSILFLRIPNAIVGISVEPGPTMPIAKRIGQKYGVALTQY